MILKKACTICVLVIYGRRKGFSRMSKPAPTLADKVRELLDQLRQLLGPRPEPALQPVPVRTRRKK